MICFTVPSDGASAAEREAKESRNAMNESKRNAALGKPFCLDECDDDYDDDHNGHDDDNEEVDGDDDNDIRARMKTFFLQLPCAQKV